MKQFFAGALAALMSVSATAITYSPISTLNPTGSTSGQVIASTGPTSAPAWTTVTLSGLGGLAAANNLSDVVSASTSRTNLGLGTAAVANTGTSGATVPLLSTANTWTLGQSFTVRPTFNGNTPYDSGNLTIASYLTTATAASTYATIAQATTALAATGGSANGVTVGAATPSTGAFTTLAASGTVSGTGFSNYLLTPPGIGSATPNQVRATSVIATTGYSLTNLVSSNTAPTIASGFGTSPSLVNTNGTAAFLIHIGTGGTASTGNLTMPAAANGWMCDAADFSSPTLLTRMTSQNTILVVLTSYNASATVTAWAAGDYVAVKCSAF
jgi:hypothetical protein